MGFTVSQLAAKINTFNRYAKRVASTFGTESLEYHNVMKMADMSGLKTFDTNGVIQVSKAKKGLQEHKQGVQALHHMSQTKTVKELKKIYDKNEDIKKQAEERLRIKIENETFYNDNYDLIQNNHDIYLQFVRAGYNENSGKHGVINPDFELAKEMVNKARDKAQEVVDNARKKYRGHSD